MVNRRQFFSNFVNRRVPPSDADRKARLQELEAYVETELLPTDYELTESKQAELSLRVRSLLNGAADKELFSSRIVDSLELLVDDVLEPPPPIR